MRFVTNGRRDTHSHSATHHNPRYIRSEDQPVYPSQPMHVADHATSTARPHNNVYTGRNVTGIALLHKQGYTPTTANSPTNNDPKRGI